MAVINENEIYFGIIGEINTGGFEAGKMYPTPNVNFAATVAGKVEEMEE